MSLLNTSRLHALVITIEPIDGGVPTMTRWVCKLLEELNIKPILAWYAPWKNYPALSVPAHKFLFGRRPSLVRQTAFEKYESYGIGSWLPELEFTHYLPNRFWKELINNCDLHLVVSGNGLSALPYLMTHIPFLAWIATPWEADRKDRIREFILPRRCLDAVVNTPILRKLEQRVLDSPLGNILCLSKYTSRMLDRLSRGKNRSVLYMPINTRQFKPDYNQTIPWRIGFSGRYCDPRKNIQLLLSATRLLVEWGNNMQLILVGDRQGDQMIPLINEYGLESNVSFYKHVNPNELSHLLQTFDIFAIPSHQEGLCIAALEAMACGVPVVSTRCGGPEDYVLPGVTGELADSNANAFALMIKSLCLDRRKRQQLSISAASWVGQNASEEASRINFLNHLCSYAKIKGLVMNY